MLMPVYRAATAGYVKNGPHLLAVLYVTAESQERGKESNQSTKHYSSRPQVNQGRSWIRLYTVRQFN